MVRQIFEVDIPMQTKESTKNPGIGGGGGIAEIGQRLIVSGGALRLDEVHG